MTKFIVIMQQVVTTDRGFETDYSWDRRKFSDRRRAISHGFETRGSDDFNIGVIKSQRLVSLDWMDKVVDDDKKLMEEIEEAICL